MKKEQSILKKTQQHVQDTINETNIKINELGKITQPLYSCLVEINNLFAQIKNTPKEDIQKFEKIKEIQTNWNNQTELIQEEYQKRVNTAGKAAVGVGAGAAIATVGPSAAMGIATTFGAASTGTAISSLSGVAATNAALAWLGGGTLATGGGGIAAGSALLGFLGPLGWSVAGIAALTGGIALYSSHKDNETLEKIYSLINERNAKTYELAAIEITERIEKIKKETVLLNNAIEKIKTFGTNYNAMTEKQQYELGAYVNLMYSTTMLLINPILGLQPIFSEHDYMAICSTKVNSYHDYYVSHKEFLMNMCNQLYKITLTDNEKEILVKHLRKDKKFMSLVKIEKKDFDIHDINMVEIALEDKIRLGNIKSFLTEN